MWIEDYFAVNNIQLKLRIWNMHIWTDDGESIVGPYLLLHSERMRVYQVTWTNMLFTKVWKLEFEVFAQSNVQV